MSESSLETNSTELEQEQAALTEIQPQILVAIEEGEDEAALC